MWVAITIVALTAFGLPSGLADPDCSWSGPVQDKAISNKNVATLSDTTLLACQAACEQTPICKSIDWKPLQDACSLNGVNEADHGGLDSWPGMQYWEKTCKVVVLGCSWSGPVQDKAISNENVATQTKTTLHACQVACEQNPNCKSIDWKPLQDACSLNGVNKAEHGGLDSWPGMQYWEKNCDADPCDNSPCHDGECVPDDSDAGFTCNCEGTAFTGTLCDHEVLANPCEGVGDLHCFTCHASTEVGCWTIGRLRKCGAGQVCAHKTITKPGSGGRMRTFSWRGCVEADHCTINGEYAIGEHNYQCEDISSPGYPESYCINCDYGPTEPEPPEKRTYDCAPPTVGTCTCKGDPECMTPDLTKVPQLSGACIYTLIENNCLDGQPFSTPSYRVSIDLEYGNPAHTKVFVSAVYIHVSAGTLGLTRNKLVVTWNGQEEDISEANVVFPKHFGGTSLALVNIAGQARVFLPEDVEVEWDFIKEVSVHLPRSQQNSVCGICGNFNGDPEDDLTIPHNYKNDDCTYKLPGGFSPGDIVDPIAYEVLTRTWFNAKSPGDSDCENECSGSG